MVPELWVQMGGAKSKGEDMKTWTPERHEAAKRLVGGNHWFDPVMESQQRELRDAIAEIERLQLFERFARYLVADDESDVLTQDMLAFWQTEYENAYKKLADFESLHAEIARLQAENARLQQSLVATTENEARYREELMRVKPLLAEKQTRVKKLRSALECVEWINETDTDNWFCPECGGDKDDGHFGDCDLRITLDAAKEER